MTKNPQNITGGDSYVGREPGAEGYDHDLNPHYRAGQNDGPEDRAREHERSAYDDKTLTRRFSRLTDEQLKQIPVVSEGARLEQGATYMDLLASERRPFTALGDMVAERGHAYVPKADMDYQLWNRLAGIENAERLGLADDA